MQTKLSETKEELNYAIEQAKKQREISVSEFFTKNRHLLGFDNPLKALSTTIKEAVDNSLDACEEAKILPELFIEIKQISESRYNVIVEDNGPGIVKEQIPRIFGKLLYGSKFHKLRQSLTHDEPIIIKHGNEIKIIPIGELVDKYIEDKEEKEISNINILVPAFDKENKYAWRKVSHIIKHKRGNEILKIRTATNREIKVTGCHSLFTLNKGEVNEVEARNLKIGDSVVLPSKIPCIGNIKKINIINYLSLKDIEKNWFYVYNIPEYVFKKLEKESRIIHKKKSKSRKFYSLKGVDILDDSFKQYKKKNFLPLHLIFKLNLINDVEDCIIKTYYHGKETKIPVTIPITKEFLRFLGFFVAEGHSDSRQIGLTFGKHEETYLKEMITFCNQFGLNFTVERRELTVRLKVFGNIFVKLIKKICKKRAENKEIPEFIFRTNREFRQYFLDALYQGDGHNTKKRNQLMLSTISKNLANQTMYLWLMQGIHACLTSKTGKGLGKNQTKAYVVTIYSKDIQVSNVFTTNIPTKAKLAVKQIVKTDVSLVKIKSIEVINKGYDYVYDISVPDCENFVGGFGGIACHNSRGQQGIGISAAALYSQLTTGKPIKITSRISPKKPAHYFEIHIDTSRNEPEILVDKETTWNKDHGIKIELELEGKYQKGKRSVEEYIRQTSISNPHVEITFIDPSKEKIVLKRATDKLPIEAEEIKPHPDGIELGILINMLKSTQSRTLQSFLTTDFSRIGPKTAKEICEKASLYPNAKPSKIARQEADNLLKAIRETKFMVPPTDCLSPIGEDLLEKGLRKEINAEFYTSVTRPASVYRGNPFIIETALAYGGSIDKESTSELIRFANRVPLQYQQSACAIAKSVISINWKPYGLQQSQGSLPVGPLVIVIHIASVWVPFTSESKEAIAHYPEIVKEIKLAIQECGRKLGLYIRKNIKAKEQQNRISLFEKYIPELADAISDLTKEDKKLIESNLLSMLKKNTKNILNQENGQS